MTKKSLQRLTCSGIHQEPRALCTAGLWLTLGKCKRPHPFLFSLLLFSVSTPRDLVAASAVPHLCPASPSHPGSSGVFWFVLFSFQVKPETLPSDINCLQSKITMCNAEISLLQEGWEWGGGKIKRPKVSSCFLHRNQGTKKAF